MKPQKDGAPGTRLVGGHGVVELFEEGVVFFRAVLLGEAQGIDAFDQDLSGGGLGFDDLDGLVEEFLKGHGARVGRLGVAHQFGLDVGRDDLEDLDAGGFELVAECLAPGVDGGLGRVVGGGEGQGDEGQAGGDGQDARVGLLYKVREQGGGEADGAEEVGGDGGFGVAEVPGLGEDVFGAHDAGVEDDGVESGEVGDELCGEGADAGGVFDVEDGGGHAGVGGGGLVEELFAAASDDDFVAELVEGLCEAAADTGAAAGDEDRVSGGFHGGDFS